MNDKLQITQIINNKNKTYFIKVNQEKGNNNLQFYKTFDSKSFKYEIDLKYCLINLDSTKNSLNIITPEEKMEIIFSNLTDAVNHEIYFKSFTLIQKDIQAIDTLDLQMKNRWPFTTS